MAELAKSCAICLCDIKSDTMLPLPNPRTDQSYQDVDQTARAIFSCEHGANHHLKCAVQQFQVPGYQGQLNLKCGVCRTPQYNGDVRVYQDQFATGIQDAGNQGISPREAHRAFENARRITPRPLEAVAMAGGALAGIILTVAIGNKILGPYADLSKTIDAKGLLSPVTHSQIRTWLTVAGGSSLGIGLVTLLAKRKDGGNRRGSWAKLWRDMSLTGIAPFAVGAIGTKVFGGLIARRYGVPQRAIWVSKEFFRLPLNYIEPIQLTQVMGGCMGLGIGSQLALRLWISPTGRPGPDGATRIVWTISLSIMMAGIGTIGTAMLIRRIKCGKALVYYPFRPGILGGLSIAIASTFSFFLTAFPLMSLWVIPRGDAEGW